MTDPPLRPRHTLPRAFACAARGVLHALRTGRNFRIQSAIAAVVLIAAAILRVAIWQWIALLVCIALVLSLELLNTAIEIVADAMWPGNSALARDAKDVAAGAVLVASVISVAVGALAFLPAIWSQF